MKRPSLWALAVTAAAILMVSAGGPVWLLAAVPAALFPLPLVNKQITWGGMAFLLLIYVLAAASAWQVWNAANPVAPWDQRECEITGIVDGIPKEGDTRTAFPFKVLQVDGSAASGRLMVTLAHYDAKGTTGTQPGEVLRLRGTVSLAEGKRNPGGFDYALYLKGQAIDGLLYVGRPSQVEAAGQWASPLYSLDRLRMTLSAACDAAFPSDQSSLIRGILFGDKAIDADVKDAFADAGISHVMAVSGLHVGYLYAFILVILGALGLKDRTVFWVLLPCLFFYAALTGFSASVIRAALMLLAAVAGKAFRHHYDPLSGLCAAAVFLLLLSPAQLFAAGFELSFGAVLGIVLFNRPLCHQWEQKTKLGKPGKIVQSLILTVCATLGTLPAMLYHFQVVNGAALIANLAVVPLVGVLLILGFVTVPLMALWPGAAGILAVLPGALAGVILWMTNQLAGLAAFSFHRGSLNLLEGALILLLALAVAGYFNLKHRRQQLALCTAVPALVLALVLMACLPRNLTITYLDVGQGDSALIETPSGGAYLIDGGGYEDHGMTVSADRTPISEKVLLPALYAKGITRLDGVFITHNHRDHAQGIEELLTEMPVGTVYVSTKYNGEALIRQTKVPVGVIAQGDSLSTGDGLSIQVLWPSRDREVLPDDEQNEASLVLRLQYGDRSFLFTGDAGLTAEPQLQVALVDTDVIKIGHHGSASATSADFLREVTPKAAVISVGKYNTYGHPTQEVLNTIKATGAACYRTDQNGAVEMATDGRSLWVRTYLKQ